MKKVVRIICSLVLAAALVVTSFWIGYRYAVALDSRLNFVLWVGSLKQSAFESSYRPNQEVLIAQYYEKLDRTPAVVGLLLRITDGEKRRISAIRARAKSYEETLETHGVPAPWVDVQELEDVLRKNNL